MSQLNTVKWLPVFIHNIKINAFYVVLISDIITTHTEHSEFKIMHKYEGVPKSIRTESITKWTTINTRWEATQRVMEVKLATLTHNSGREVYDLQFSLQVVSPETLGMKYQTYNK
jgi:hypothetical protein